MKRRKEPRFLMTLLSHLIKNPWNFPSYDSVFCGIKNCLIGVGL